MEELTITLNSNRVLSDSDGKPYLQVSISTISDT